MILSLQDSNFILCLFQRNLGKITEVNKITTDNIFLMSMLKIKIIIHFFCLPSPARGKGENIYKPLMYYKHTSSFPADLEVPQFFYTYPDESVLSLS